MHEPHFWYKSPGLLSLILSPLGKLYSFLTAKRLKKTPYKAKIPVICIGNINVGGTGKTPVTIALAQYLIYIGYQPQIVSKGYKGKLKGPVQVNNHKSFEVGDEPIMLSAFAPTWVSKDRAEGVRAAEIAGADVILLDDGFQNPSVFKDLSIVVVDGKRGWGNKCVLPAGPLREPVDTGLKRTDLIVIIGNEVIDTQDITFTNANLLPLKTGMPWHNMRVIGFAGIGNPNKFLQTLKDLGCHVIQFYPLEDHQPLSFSLLKRLEKAAINENAKLVTTEKDATRLPHIFKNKVFPIPVRLEFQNIDIIEEKLRKIGITKCVDKTGKN